MFEAVEARERHIELHWLLKVMETRGVIPSTFDDRFPEEVFSIDQTAPLRVGNTYLVPDETGDEFPGILYEGVVSERERKATCIFQLADGRHIICTVPLTEAEVAIYRQSPDTFFGILKHVPKGLKQPIDMYDFLHETYAKTPRSKLLEFIANWPEFYEWRDLPEEELAKRYCARMAEGMWVQFGAPNSANATPI
jgi:hypothetical protein